METARCWLPGWFVEMLATERLIRPQIAQDDSEYHVGERLDVGFRMINECDTEGTEVQS